MDYLWILWAGQPSGTFQKTSKCRSATVGLAMVSAYLLVLVLWALVAHQVCLLCNVSLSSTFRRTFMGLLSTGTCWRLSQVSLHMTSLCARFHPCLPTSPGMTKPRGINRINVCAGATGTFYLLIEHSSSLAVWMSFPKDHLGQASETGLCYKQQSRCSARQEIPIEA